MEISEIKAQLTIGQVLDHYNLSTDKNNLLRCPFHDDKTPSLQIYPQTNTFCCFSSNCNAGTGDVIEFIRLMEKCMKHEAILKAKSLLGHPDKSGRITETKADPPDALSRVAVLTKFVEACRKGIAGSERARIYATERGLDWQMLSLGFTADKVSDAWNKNYKESAASLGLLTKTQDGRYINRHKLDGYWRLAFGCAVFQLSSVDCLLSTEGFRPSCGYCHECTNNFWLLAVDDWLLALVVGCEICRLPTVGFSSRCGYCHECTNGF